ncbi:MAG: hypothetical protein H7A00_00555 [Hahellaceae bacterium]|nr:hypothetical protein [Hahellaceae bacterium]
MMVVRDVVHERMGRAKAFVDHVREVYERAYMKAIDAGRDGVDGIARAREQWPPRVKSVVQGTVGAAEQVLDGFNQSLAQKAIPSVRKSTVLNDRFKSMEASISATSVANDNAMSASTDR